jgi:hypothetical protein
MAEKLALISKDQADALDAMAMAVIEEIEKYGLTCIVIVSGRGYERLAISKENAADAPLLLASSYASLEKHNRNQAN